MRIHVGHLYDDHNPVTALELETYEMLATNDVRDLGVGIDDKVQFTARINQTVSKA
jgi:hypothetical protein